MGYSFRVGSKFPRQKVSKDTLRRAIRITHLRHWKSLKRIYLSRKAVLERSRFYREWRGKEEATQVILFLTPLFLSTNPLKRASILTSVLWPPTPRILLTGYSDFRTSDVIDGWLILRTMDSQISQ